MSGAAKLDPASQNASAEEIIAATRTWLERAVIGLGLCPFAERVHLRNGIRYCVSEQQSTDGLIADLSQELQGLRNADPDLCETSLLIHPRMLGNFNDYNNFLGDADDAVLALGLEGELQIASFHPDYRFAGSEPDDIENYSNRSPYPMLHLLRESSVARAVESYPRVGEIGDKNIAILRRLGHAGWRSLWVESV